MPARELQMGEVFPEDPCRGSLGTSMTIAVIQGQKPSSNVPTVWSKKLSYSHPSRLGNCTAEEKFGAGFKKWVWAHAYLAG